MSEIRHCSMRPSYQKVIAKNKSVEKRVNPKVRYHCHDSRAIRIVFSTFCTGGLAVKLSIFSVTVSVIDLTDSVKLSPIALMVLLCESMDDCIVLTFSITAEDMDVPTFLRSSAAPSAILHHLTDTWGEMSRCRTEPVQNGA